MAEIHGGQPAESLSIGQIAVTVSDVSKALAFYRDILGLHFLFSPSDSMAFLSAGDIRLMLSTPQGSGTPGANSILYFKVSGIEQAHASFVSRGARSERAPSLAAKLPDHDLWLGFLRDPDDNLVGLMEERVTITGAVSADLSFSRLLPTSDGGSRFETLAIPVTQQNFAPPAQPFGVSALSQATQCGFLCLPAGWVGEMHPSPMRMWIHVLEGEMRFEASNGEARHVAPGSSLLLEDTEGRGHLSQVVGPRPATLAVVRLPEPR
jgi:catechol 2,3-dioxygenase-like lactoylglutathione lyase family enzyme